MHHNNKINFRHTSSFNPLVKNIVVLSCLFFSTNLLAQVSVYYAGIAYMGNYSAKETFYKYSSRLIDDDEALLQRALRQRLQSINNDNFNLVIGAQPVDYKKDDALVMAFAIEYENVSIEKIGMEYKIDIDLRANILVFDYNELKIISSHPVALQLRDASDHNPTEAELLEKIRSLYLGSKELNIFDEFTKRLSTLNLKRHYSNTLKVRSVTILDNAILSIPNIKEKYVQYNYETLLAQQFSTYLSKNQNVSVLPYTKGHAIGNKMALQIANGEVYNLKVPDETYAIDIELQDLKKAKMGSNDYKSIWGYASYFKFKLSIPDETDMFTDAKFRGLIKKTILKNTSHTVDDWSIYKESMNRLLENLSRNISERDGSWLKSTTKTQNVVAQLQKFEEIIKSCQ